MGNVFHCQSFLASAHEISPDMLRLPSLSVRGFLKSYHAGIGRCLGAAFWGLNFEWRAGPYQMASTVPRLRGAVELLLTGDQHRPCARFNEQACKNTTSAAKGKRESPQKIASKCATISKKRPHFGVHKLTRFGVRLRVRILF